ncbi:MAG TPA: GDP-mannose 4,6-dehydratase, partial [Gammaproteobacteria bacterium]|nr:GDP-mannose 4,6-dehydratase [Gammaproteobacteria bacterium]
DAAFKEVGIDIRWEGKGVDEKGYDARSGTLLVEVDPRYFRPTEVETLLGDSTKAREKLGWVPEIGLEEMVAEMVRADLRIAERDELCRREGFETFDYNE